MTTELVALFYFQKSSVVFFLIVKQSATTVGPLLTEVWQGGSGGLPKKFTNTLFGVFSLTYLQQGYQTFTKENQECLSSFESIYIKANLIYSKGEQ